jgi:hypothetical protein
MAADPIAQRVFDRAFNVPRYARSDEYKRGVLNCLKVRLDGAKNVTCPWLEGSAQADAYYAGVVEGRILSPVKRVPVGFDNVNDSTPVYMTS